MKVLKKLLCVFLVLALMVAFFPPAGRAGEGGGKAEATLALATAARLRCAPVPPHSPGPPFPNCKCGCTETGVCDCKDCDHPKGKSPQPPCPNCQCGCVSTGKCVCKDCDHPLLKKPTATAADAYEVSLFDGSGATVVCTTRLTLPAGAGWPQTINCCGKTFSLRPLDWSHRKRWYGEDVPATFTPAFAPAPQFFAPPPMTYGGFGGGMRFGGGFRRGGGGC